MAKNEAYDEAERKIKEVKRTGAASLDLSVDDHLKDIDKLSEIPDSVWELSWLKSLSINHHNLTTLPKGVNQLMSLNSLELSGNQILELPEFLAKHRELRELAIGGNPFGAVPKVIQKMPWLERLILFACELEALPEWIGELDSLKQFGIANNMIKDLPYTFGRLKNLERLYLGWSIGSGSAISNVPTAIRHFHKLSYLNISKTHISSLPEWIGQLKNLNEIILDKTQVSDLPTSLSQLKHLKELDLRRSPLNPELAAAYKQGLDAVKAYLLAKEEKQIVLNEAKLILVGEGGVGKSSLLASLRGDKWVENRKSTEGVEVDIKSLVIEDNESKSEITLNGWDFGGQNIYRHTHQLFFTAPAVYLAVWEPRRGPEQCRVEEWIKLIKNRAYDESRTEERPRILIVATHGGPGKRLSHIDEQSLLDEFGDMIVGFHHVDSKPGKDGICYQLEELKTAIGREAAAIPSVGRSVPLSWKKVLEAIRERSETVPYINYREFESICDKQSVSKELASTYALILNELGHLIYYRNDETLKDTIILKPDYLSKAVGFVLEDNVAKSNNGLVQHKRLFQLWNNTKRPEKERYPKELHPVFLRLMTKFDLSYQVNIQGKNKAPTSLMAQLVPSQRPDGWEEDWASSEGESERKQVVRVLDAHTGRTVEAEGLMYRLIVRLHRYSLGRDNYEDSRHWKTGMLLDDNYNGRAFIEEIGGDVQVTVRAAYPELFLHQLCTEVQWLVENFWKGLKAKLFVLCKTEDCNGLIEVGEIIDFKKAQMPKVRCGLCEKFHEVDGLMTSVQPKPEYENMVKELRSAKNEIIGAFKSETHHLDKQLKTLMSQADEQYQALLTTLTDPAKEGPRLFSFEPVNRSKFNPNSWTKNKFKLTLWCEHRRVPLTVLNEDGDTRGVYEIELTKEWVQKAAPVLKVVSTTLSLALSIAVPGTKLAAGEDAYKAIAGELEFGVTTSKALLKASDDVGDWLTTDEQSDLSRTNDLIRAQGSTLRELHAMLKKADPASSFGGLVRVQNKRRQFLWVHESFVSEY